MALYIPHSIFHLGRLLYVRPETFGPYCVVIRNLIYMNRELNLDIDKKKFQELECQAEDFMKGDLIEPSHRGGDKITVKEHDAEKP